MRTWWQGKATGVYMLTSHRTSARRALQSRKAAFLICWWLETRKQTWNGKNYQTREDRKKNRWRLARSGYLWIFCSCSEKSILLLWKSCVENRQPEKQPVNSKWALKRQWHNRSTKLQQKTNTSSDLQAHRKELHVCSFLLCPKWRIHDNGVNKDACTKLFSISQKVRDALEYWKHKHIIQLLRTKKNAFKLSHFHLIALYEAAWSTLSARWLIWPIIIVKTMNH